MQRLTFEHRLVESYTTTRCKWEFFMIDSSIKHVLASYTKCDIQCDTAKFGLKPYILVSKGGMQLDWLLDYYIFSTPKTLGIRLVVILNSNSN